MKLILISKHFYPEEFFINYIVKELQDIHDVKIRIYTSFPYYNYDISKGLDYKSKEYISDIIRVKSVLPKNKKVINIFLNYFTFIFNLSVKILKDRKKLKSNLILIFATSPIYQAIPAIILKKIFKKKIIIWVQDLWPEILIDHKYIKNKFIKNILFNLSNLIYKNSDLILAQNYDAEVYLKKKYQIKKILTHFNPSISKKNEFVEIAKEIDVFKIAYTGNIGESQNLLEVLKIIRKSKSKFIFYIIGEGSEKEKLKNFIHNNNLENKFIIKKQIDKKELDYFIKNIDGLFISLSSGVSLSKTIPGKFSYYLSKSLPIFSVSDGITNNLIKNKNLGLTSSSANYDELLKKFNTFISLKYSDRILISNNCKKLYFEYFEFKNNVRKFKSILDNYI